MVDNLNENPFISAMENEKTGKNDLQQFYNAQQYLVNPNAEKVVGIVASVNLIIGALGFFVLLIIAIGNYEWLYFGIGVGVLLCGVVLWAFLKVLVNISRNLYNVSETLKEFKQ